MPQSIQGRFIWQELMTADTAASTAFYPKLLGWKSEPSVANPDYTMFSASRGPVAGMMLLPEGVRQMGGRPQWLTYLGADDVEATLSAIEIAGGKRLRPIQDIANVGRFAIVSDPQGAPFAIFTPAYEVPAESGPPKHGEYSWQELHTTDSEAAFTFYRNVFGWQEMSRMPMGALGDYLIFGTGGVQRGGMFKSPQLPAGPSWLSYVTVPNADAAASMTAAAGGKVLNGPMDVPGGGRIAQLADSTGVAFAVYALPKAAPAPKPAPKPAAAKPAAAPAAAPPAKPAATPKAVEKPAAKPAVAAAPAAKPVVKPAAPKKKAAPKKPAAKKKAPAKANKKAKVVKKATKKKGGKRKPAAAQKRTAARAKSKRAPAKKKAAKRAGKKARSKK